jgi:predicted nuclease of predicted toxin-antitoxin system
VEYPITHVYRALPDYVGPQVGQCQAPDQEIAKWCAQTEHVLVTPDKDFWGRWIRSNLLASHGVEVIVFSEVIAGLQEQHRRVTKHLPAWEETLGPNRYGHRVWVQTTRLRPGIIKGKRKVRAEGLAAQQSGR